MLSAPGVDEALAAAVSPLREVAWIEEVPKPGGVTGAPVTETSQALMQLRGSLFLRGDPSPSFADQDDLGLEAFELDEVAEREEWSRIWGYIWSSSRSCTG